MPLTQEDVLSALKQCYDPKIPVNIVDLGLIYEVRFDSVPEDQQDVVVEMTLTAQGCPSMSTSALRSNRGLSNYPACAMPPLTSSGTPLDPERLSPDARKQLGIE